MKRGYILRVIACCIAGSALLAGFDAAAKRPSVPDLTKAGAPDETHDWNLGPTGARGWMWGWRGQTKDARQILVTEIGEGSPAAGVLRKGDVIIGVDEKLFECDARKSFARAITEAEKKENGGNLDLVVFRDGKRGKMRIKLAVMGSYSETAPYDCGKSRRILENGCVAIAEKGFKNRRGNIRLSLENDLNAMALLASGMGKYMPLVDAYAKKAAASTPGGYVCWGYGYRTLFLAEYLLATGNRELMPELERLATDIARGQGLMGTWGHRFARPSGILRGYGCMNQPGIVLTLAMVVAREAGVESPVLNKAISKSLRFLEWYVDKGAIPYGDHAPWDGHEDNGKCSSAAVLYDAAGKRKATAFFGRMATAAYEERERGHTGNFFNILWALPGVSRCGPNATGAYLNETGWYYDLAREWDGRFGFQGVPASHGKYRGWDCTGAYLLAYALPERQTIVTGRKPAVVKPLTKTESDKLIAAGRWDSWSGQEDYYDRRPKEDLFNGLSSWSPAVRTRCARALGKRDDVSAQRLISMLDAISETMRYGACEALRYQGGRADPAAGQLRNLLKSSNPWMRVLAAQALVDMSDSVREAAVHDLLRAVVDSEDPEDPRRCTVQYLAEVLFMRGPGKRWPDSILSQSLNSVDPSDHKLLMEAIREILRNPDGRTRSRLNKVFALLSREDLAELMPDIIKATREMAPSGRMFAYGIRMRGLELLANLRIQEGMDLCVDIMGEDCWGRDFKRPARALREYGGVAKAVLPRLRAEILPAIKKKGGEELKILRKLLEAIESDNSPKPVRSAKDFIENFDQDQESIIGTHHL